MKKYPLVITLVVLVVVIIPGLILAEESEMDYAVNPVDMGHYNIYFIKTATGYILVDTGMPKKENKLDEAFNRAGVKPEQVNLIILTHTHLDHAGSTAYAKQITGADVLCHENAANFLRAGKSVPAVARNFMGKFLNFISPKSYEGIEPDIITADEYDLAIHGIEGKIVHSPGHTEDSICIILASGEMLVGDIIRGQEPDINLGMFYENKLVLIQSLERLVDYNPERIYMSHGAYIDGKTFQKTVTQLRQ